MVTTTRTPTDIYFNFGGVGPERSQIVTHLDELKGGIDAVEATLGNEAFGLSMLALEDQAALQAAAGQAVAISTAINAQNQFFHIYDTKPQGQSGGASISGYQARTLNTESPLNNLPGVVVHSDTEFTLPAGSYDIEASAPAHNVVRHKIRLYDITNLEVLTNNGQELYGSSEYMTSTASVQTRSHMRRQVTLVSPTRLRLEHYTQNAKTGNGLGVESSSGPEVYAMFTARKFA